MAPKNEPTEDWQVNYPEIQMRAAYLLRTREWADCTFQFQTDDAASETTSLDAHQLILAMASPVFAAMFYGYVGDKRTPLIISDIDLPTFSALLKYVYTDQAEIPSSEAAINLYKAANKYILVHLEKMCLDYLFKECNPDNVCQIYEFACFFGENLLEQKCLEMFSNKTQFVLKGSGFRNAEPETLKKIVSMDILAINSEMDLFNALLDYVENTKDGGEKDAIESYEDAKDNENVEHGENDNNINKEDDTDADNKLPENSVSLSSSAKPEKTRSMLKGVIEQIRFLSMTPADLAKINESSTLLSKDEICALLTNMFSPNSNIPMPDGFSRIRDARIRGAGTFRHTIHNITSMTVGKKVYSPCYIRKLPWRILAMKESTRLADYLSFHLVCDVDSLHHSPPGVPEDWSYYAKFELRLLTILPQVEPKTKKIEHVFCKKDPEAGYHHFIDWNKLMDPMFIENNSITLEVHFITEPVQCVDFKQYFKGEKKT
ncbi:BTB/POZ domain-containing protein [Phthorimaea operculella]|nr:BTB/POZ domain-containing protein [Phthorimaea operculella]